METLNLTPIGIVNNEIKTPVATKWGKVISDIRINDDLVAGLDGLTDWSHVIVIFSMHETNFDPEQHLVQRPHERDDMPEVGIFAQRARQHPNRIGISAVRLMAVIPPIVRVKGLDAIDGTPILDIKPYAPVYDGVSDPLVPSWFIRLMQGYF